MFDIKYEVLDEIKIGKGKKIGTHLRLVQSQKGKKVIQCWSSLSSQWNTMYRYNVDEAWTQWKNTETGIKNPKFTAKKRRKSAKKG
jgi:hypothetical protein